MNYQYRSSLLFRAVGTLLIAFGFLVAMAGLALRGEDEIWLKVVAAGVLFLGVGMLMIELMGMRFTLTGDRIEYRKVFRGGTVAYCDMKLIEARVSYGQYGMLATQVKIWCFAGNRLWLSIFGRRIDWQPFLLWAAENGREDVLQVEE